MSNAESKHPPVLDPKSVGTWPARTRAGGGLVWDEVLEYRVWCTPESGSDWMAAFAAYEDALAFASSTPGAKPPLALVLQREYIDQPSASEYTHVRAERITEWPVSFLSRPRRTARTIPDFLAPDAPPNRLDILRGTAGI